MTLGVKEVPKDETLRKFANQVNRIFRRRLSQISEAGYGWHGYKMGYYARGVDEKGKNTMVLVNFFADALENPNSLYITLFPGLNPNYVSVYTEGEKKDIFDERDFTTRVKITRITLPKEQFEMQARAYSINYNQEPPYLEIIRNLQTTPNQID